MKTHQFENFPKLEQIAESAATAAFGQIFEFSPTDFTVPGAVSPAYRRGNQIAYFGFNIFMLFQTYPSPKLYQEVNNRQLSRLN